MHGSCAEKEPPPTVAQRLPVPTTRRARRLVKQETGWQNFSLFKNVFTLNSLNLLFSLYPNEFQKSTVWNTRMLSGSKLVLVIAGFVLLN